ncbi:MAG: pyruvate:ferredoxin (flavodoxin) oxidoreductase [Fimbriimonadaceae bacterium]|jgi:pyruvate-ferredoxin/flavodoxin oxidoreductase|nr:pyruvate:ferredoxin (flavodoxin) oxidoreductase [Fimbriimonadaceae bacterium]
MNKSHPYDTLQGNEAVAYVAYRLNEVCAIYPITPSSGMAELADQWASEGKKNIWGNIPEVIEMQSEGGAAGAVHGSLQMGALATTFTASQGLLLMIPNMYKIAGELTPTVFHVAARSLATNSLSIFGDHQDVMAVRQTGFALLASSSVQEAHDMALVSQAATLASRVPFLHFFDGFRTSHEVNKCLILTDDQMRSLVSEEAILSHRSRALNPDRPTIRGTASNPDTAFQSREAGNLVTQACPAIVKETLDQFYQVVGRRYELFEYSGAADAERVIVIMGSGSETVRETVLKLTEQGEKVGCVKVRLYRPFDGLAFCSALPNTVKAIAIMDRTKEPGSLGEPLYGDVVVALAQEGRTVPCVIGGRYGLSSKEFTPAMVASIFGELANAEPKRKFTVGIYDDVSHLSLSVNEDLFPESDVVFRSIFYGLGSDGTVGANKNTIKIIGEKDGTYAQGYFVYDSKKSGSTTISHLRFGPNPIEAPYLIRQAHFIGCHHFAFLQKFNVLENAGVGATLLINSPYPPELLWDQLPAETQSEILTKRIRVFAIDANSVAREVGMAGRTNTIMQTCFFGISGVLPKEEAITRIKKAIEKTYKKKGQSIVQKNWQAVDLTLERLHELSLPNEVTSNRTFLPPLAPNSPDALHPFIGRMIQGKGDLIPVSAMPKDGVFPSGTTRYEKRNIAELIPIWSHDTCVQCGNCGFVCPHSAIRAKLFHQSHLESAPEGFPSAPIDARGFPETKYSLQVYGEDCTGCGLCVQVCPVREDSGERAINMAEKDAGMERCKPYEAFFESLPLNDRSRVDFSTVRGVQFLQPTFEFSGACAGCGETPYLKLLSQLFGDRMVVANATGCSSIYVGNLPTTPWATNNEGRGPAWANSLFEDNAEFGLGMRLAADRHLTEAQSLLEELAPKVGKELADALLTAPQATESQIRQQRKRIEELEAQLHQLAEPAATRLHSLVHHFARRSVWIIGGDGWAYDIGSSGLDHVLASGRDVNILVMDTEVYSNTGGQASKSTPIGAVAKFAAKGKTIGKKDIALQAASYGNVYVARIAMGANPQQTLLAFREAEAYPGPSLIIAYSHCIAHGINMEQGLHQQRMAVLSGYWPLMRYNPVLRDQGTSAFMLDSSRATRSFKDYAMQEQRYRQLHQSNPTHADELMTLAEEAIQKKWDLYEQMAQII